MDPIIKSYLDCIRTILSPNSLLELVNDNELECIYRGVKVKIQHRLHIANSINIQDVYAVEITNQLGDVVNSSFVFYDQKFDINDEKFMNFIIDMFTKIRNTCDLMTTEMEE